MSVWLLHEIEQRFRFSICSTHDFLVPLTRKDIRSRSQSEGKIKMMATTSNESTTRNPVFNLLDRETVRITSCPRHEDESEPTVSGNLRLKEYLREESMPTISDESKFVQTLHICRDCRARGSWGPFQSRGDRQNERERERERERENGIK